jgi:hypothetical protein
MKTAGQQLVLSSFESKRVYPSRALRDILPLCTFVSSVDSSFCTSSTTKDTKVHIRCRVRNLCRTCLRSYSEIPLMDAIRLRKKPMMFVYNYESLQIKCIFPYYWQRWLAERSSI